MKTLLGMVTFGNIEFTKLAIQSIEDTSKAELDYFIVVGKPGDTATLDWLQTKPNIKYIVHSENMGFPYSINDIFDYAWVINNYDYVILAGNDIIAYPFCIDSLLESAQTTDNACISALQIDVNMLTILYPGTAEYFSGSNKIFTDFTQSPWNIFNGYSAVLTVAPSQLHDIQNLCLYKREVFDTLGYADVNFYPAYFVDNDYAMRIIKAGIKGCTLTNARFFHFWSRTIKQGEGGSTDKQFGNNAKYYRQKWGGDFGKETITPAIKISDRTSEVETINYWKAK